MGTVITRAEFASDMGVPRQAITAAWYASPSHPSPVHSNAAGTRQYYETADLLAWWEEYQKQAAAGQALKEDSTRSWQVNTRFTPADKRRIEAVMHPGESYAAAFHRLALAGLKIEETIGNENYPA